MSWLDTDAIRKKFNIAANRFDTQIEAASASAALIIQRGVTTEIYDEAVDDTEPTGGDELIRYKSVVEAHSFLTMWFLVGNVGNRLGEMGFIKNAQDSGSPAMNSKLITNQYLTPAELEKMRNAFLSNANLWIGPYGTIDITPEIATSGDGFAVSSLAWF